MGGCNRIRSQEMGSEKKLATKKKPIKVGDERINADSDDAQHLTNRARQRLDTRNLVFECAIEEFQRVGIENAQIEPIVKRAGVSVGTFYRYFINREDVLHELQRRNATIMLDRFAGLKKTTNFRSYLKQIVSALLIDAPSSKNDARTGGSWSAS